MQLYETITIKYQKVKCQKVLENAFPSTFHEERKEKNEEKVLFGLRRCSYVRQNGFWGVGLGHELSDESFPENKRRQSS